LISALLGEMEKIKGTVAVRGAIAYAGQQAWIQRNSVRDNIIFGTEFEAEYFSARQHGTALADVCA
jgi:ABC-type iron transport system FetAB ATPase subunit